MTDSRVRERANKNESHAKGAKAASERGLTLVTTFFGLKPHIRLSHTNLPTKH